MIYTCKRVYTINYIRMEIVSNKVVYELPKGIIMNTTIKVNVKKVIIATLDAKKAALIDLGVEITPAIEKNIFKKEIKFSFLKGLITTAKRDTFSDLSNSLLIKRDMLLKEVASVNAEINALKASIYGQSTVTTLKSNTNFKTVERGSYYSSEEYATVKQHLVEKLTTSEVNPAKYLCDLATFWQEANFKSDNSKFLADKVTLNFASLKANIQSNSILHDLITRLLGSDEKNLLKIGKNSFRFSHDNKVYLA